ncbi:MAG: lysophospholipid acyltransferase family protein [Novosphingobium sp.]
MDETPAGVAVIPPAGLLRIAVRVTAMAMLLLACVPLYYACRLVDVRNPWPRRFLSGIARIAGVTIKITGERPGSGEFLLANHVSWIDVPALAAASGSAFVAHDGLGTQPLLRWLCAMNDTVLVARHDRASVHRQVEQVRAAIRDTGALTIFPEGTTSDGTGLLQFKSSLLSALEPLPAGIAVRPVVLDYGAEAPTIAWIGTEHGLDNFKRIVGRSKPIQLNVRFLPVLSDEALTNRKTIAAAAQAAILQALRAACGKSATVTESNLARPGGVATGSPSDSVASLARVPDPHCTTLLAEKLPVTISVVQIYRTPL